MRPELIGEVCSNAIPILFGAYIALLGFRIVGKPEGTNESYDEWHGRYGGFLKVGGMALILVGLLQVSFSLSRDRSIVRPSTLSEKSHWTRHATSDGTCSAEFPSTPTASTQSAYGIESTRLSVQTAGCNYRLSYSDLSGADEATDEQRYDAIRDSMPELGAQEGITYLFLEEARITEGSHVGRAIKFSVDKNGYMYMKVYIVRNRLYRLIAVSPQTNPMDEMTKRFFDSLQFEHQS